MNLPTRKLIINFDVVEFTAEGCLGGVRIVPIRQHSQTESRLKGLNEDIAHVQPCLSSNRYAKVRLSSD